jgi:AAA ATPase domain
MLKSLKIKNFRCLEEFDLPQLGRVNLLVGKNNSGKTSVLEAIHMLDSVSPISLWEAIERRGEYFESNREEDISHINHFYLGHEIEDGNEIVISGSKKDGSVLFELFTNQKYDPLEDWISEKSEKSTVCVWTSFDENNEVKSHQEFTVDLYRKSPLNSQRTIPELIEWNGINWGSGKNTVVHIKDYEGYENILKPGSISTELKADGIEASGILLDADEQPQDRWIAIRNACRASKLVSNIPEELPEAGLIIGADNDVRIGIWIMPDNKLPGNVGDVRDSLVKRSTL